MQGQRSTTNSLPDTFEFEHGSSTSNIGANQPHFWNNRLHPVDSLLPDYQRSPNDANNTYMNAVICDGRSSSDWHFGEPSSSENRSSQITHDEVKLEERRYEPTNILSLESLNGSRSSNPDPNGPLYLQNLSSSDIPQNPNLSASSGSSGNGDQTMESNIYKPGGSETEHIPSAGNTGNLTDESDGRPGSSSLDGRRLSCKRKAHEGGVSRQLSLDGGPSGSHRAANSVWNAVPARINAASSSSISTSTSNPIAVNSPQLNPQLGVGVRVVTSDSHPTSSMVGNAESSPGNLYMSIFSARQATNSHPTLSVAGNAESSSQGNVYMSINPAHQASPSNLPSTRNVIRRSHVRSPHQLVPHQMLPHQMLPHQMLPHESSSRPLPFNHPTAPNTTSPMSQPHIIHIPGLQRNMHPSPWNGNSNLRVGSVSGASVIPGERSVPQEEVQVHSRGMPRNISENPMFSQVTDLRNFAQDPSNWNLTNGTINIPGNVASSSQIGSSSGVYRSVPPPWASHNNPPIHYPRQLSEVVRRSVIIPSAGSEPGGSSSSFPPVRSVPASSQEMVPSVQAGHPGNHQPYARSTIWTPRQGDGLPLPFRSLAAAGDGRSRLLSEIRNVLDFIRRNGDGMRFESILMGATNLQDRHRDMRLDVDNMSYEELLALEERIGFVNTGLGEHAILTCLKQRKYLLINDEGTSSEAEPCCICQEEYVEGEDIGALNCGHEFHTDCIKQWLMNKNICPICKLTGLAI